MADPLILDAAVLATLEEKAEQALKARTLFDSPEWLTVDHQRAYEARKLLDGWMIRPEIVLRLVRQILRWRPISTAPKDMSVLVLCPHGCYVASYDERIHGQGIFGWSVDDNKHGPYALRGADPTHWMPLPDPPKDPADV